MADNHDMEYQHYGPVGWGYHPFSQGILCMFVGMTFTLVSRSEKFLTAEMIIQIINVAKWPVVLGLSFRTLVYCIMQILRYRLKMKELDIKLEQEKNKATKKTTRTTKKRTTKSTAKK